MNRNQARRILWDYRPDVSQPSAATQEALEFAAQDAELNRWFDDQQNWHATVRAELRSIQPPPDLKELILAQGQLAQERFAEPPVLIPLWRRPALAWAAAAAIALLIGLSALLLRPQTESLSYEAFQARMVGFALREYRMDIVTDDRQEIRRFLAEHGREADYELTRGLEAAPALGGARLSWQGHPVSMICFALGQREMLYLFVLPEEAIQEGGLPTETPQFAPSKGLMTASWRRKEKVYLLAGPLEQEALKKFL
jgi:anti-sigma factor RsiW